MESVIVLVLSCLALFLVSAFALHILYIIPMRKESRNLRDALELTATSILEAVKKSPDNDVVSMQRHTIKSLEAELEALQTEYVKTINDYASDALLMSADLDVLKDNNSKLGKTISDLEEKFVSIKDTINIPGAVIDVSENINLKEFRTSIDDVLVTLGIPQNVYESGVYNGVVAVSNVFLDAAYAFVKPVDTVVKHDAKRDSKGRFIKA